MTGPLDPSLGPDCFTPSRRGRGETLRNLLGHGCGGPGFGGRTPDLVQAVFSAPDGHQVDGDLVCTLRPDLMRVLG